MKHDPILKVPAVPQPHNDPFPGATMLTAITTEQFGLIWGFMAMELDSVYMSLSSFF